MSAWTWETLNAADREVLEEVMRTGATPDIEQLLGYTYRGLNSGLVPRITGRKFKKVFHEHEGRPFGHNVVGRRGNPVEIGWFSVRSEGRLVRFDYNVRQNSGLNFPLRGIQDFVVLPNPDDHTLVLGKAYFLKLRVAYFVLQRETV
jgi:hypothetical protein